MKAPAEQSPKSAAQTSALLFTLFFPTVLTWLYFVCGAELPAGTMKACYGIGKGIQFLFPVLWVAFVLKRRWFVRRFNFRGVPQGFCFGLVVALVIFGGGWALLSSGSELAERLCEEFTGRLESFGLTSRGMYTALLLFYSICHSGLEEYYWRWFAFGRLAERRSWLQSALIANGAFMLHHVVLLSVYFGALSFLTWFCALGVAVGGLVWQTIYKRYDSIYGGWISHGLIDAGIFALGYLMLP